MSAGGMKAVLVTGGARRLGEAISRYLAKSGWFVVIHCNQSVEAAEALVAEIKQGAVVRQDLLDTDACASLIGRAAEAAGRPLAALVNNAAIFDYDTALDVSPEMLEDHWRINLAAPLMLSAAFAKQAVDEDNPGIVNIVDQKIVNPNPDFFSYTASKAALGGMLAPMALGFAGKCRVNAVAPGALLPSFGRSQESFDRIKADNPQHQAIDLEEVARAVGFLLESKAANGETLFAANGQQLVSSLRDVMFNADV
jgi:NAD(P)-dependent dehydrogenase (short-subunit alcohol dehydrogenase family)